MPQKKGAPRHLSIPHHPLTFLPSLSRSPPPPQGQIPPNAPLQYQVPAKPKPTVPSEHRESIQTWLDADLARVQIEKQVKESRRHYWEDHDQWGNYLPDQSQEDRDAWKRYCDNPY